MLIKAKLIQVAKLYSNRHHYYGGHLKVLIDKKEKILKGSLDWIPSPSVKIQINWRESLLDVWRQNIAMFCLIT